jgi:hypothetical protein
MFKVVEGPKQCSFDILLRSIVRYRHLSFNVYVILEPMYYCGAACNIRYSLRFFACFSVCIIHFAAIYNKKFNGVAVKVAGFDYQFVGMGKTAVETDSFEEIFT